MPTEPELQQLPQGGLKLGAEWHRKVVRRIEHIKPITKPKSGIRITPTDRGQELSLDTGAQNVVTYTMHQMQAFTASVTVTVEPLLVCSGGTTTTMYVLTATGANIQNLVSQTANLVQPGAVRLVPTDPAGLADGDTALIIHATKS